MITKQKKLEIGIKKYYLYLGISLLITLYYGVYFYYFAFSQEYVVQDDVRQHIVWLQRFIDPELFQQDIISNYFYSLAPFGFKFLYVSLANLGISPLFVAKLLPPILAVITTIYTYLLTLEILPLPLAGCLSSLFINQLIWLNDDLVSATPRAFLYPLFAAFLYYFAKNKIIPCLILMLLQGWFYPHILLIEMVILSLRLLVFKRKISIKLTDNKQYYFWWILGVIVTAIAIYPLTQKPPELATVMTAEQMQQMPEFNPGGRTPVFGGNIIFKIFFHGNSGLALPPFPTIVWCSFGLPWLLKTKLPSISLITHKIAILRQVTVASLLMFVLSYLTLPALHLPSRFTYHSLRVVLAIATGIMLTILLNSALVWFKGKKQFLLSDKIKITLVSLIATSIVVVPAIPHIFTDWFQNWKVGTAPAIYQYIAQQPKDTLIASISEEADNIPAFTQRSVLVAGEFAMAYHPSYYNQIKQRTVDLLQAQYSFNIDVVRSFVEQYGIDYWLLDKNAFTPQYLLSQDWLINSSWSKETTKIVEQLELGAYSALNELVSSCAVVSTDNLDLLDSRCILKSSSKNNKRD